ncbi:MAG: hypothetical protein ACKO7C_08475 [Bacteroidota bacterium]
MNTKTNPTYQPNDIEVIIKNKSFSELLPDEKEFVLQHISSEEEFNQLKQLWFSIESEEMDMQDPPKHIWKNLRNQFKKEKQEKNAFTIWLNSVRTWWMNLNTFGQMSLAMASVALILSGVWLTIQQPNDSVVLAAATREELKSFSDTIQSEANSNQNTLEMKERPLAELNLNEPPVNAIIEVENADNLHDVEAVQDVPYPENDGVIQIKSESNSNLNQAPAMPNVAPSDDNFIQTESIESKTSTEKEILLTPADSLKKKQEELKKKKKKK